MLSIGARTGESSIELSRALILVLVLLALGLAHAQSVGVRPTPFSTNASVFLPVHNLLFPEPTKYWANLKPPFPTNAWWTNFAYPDFPMITYPYLQTPTDNSLTVCVPELSVTDVSFTSACSVALTFYNTLLDTRRVFSWDRLGVVGEFTSHDDNSLPSMRVPFVQGSPFATIFFQSRGTVLNMTTPEGYFLQSLDGKAPEQGASAWFNVLRFTVAATPTDNPHPNPPPPYPTFLRSLLACLPLFSSYLHEGEDAIYAVVHSSVNIIVSKVQQNNMSSSIRLVSSWVIYSLNGPVRYTYFTERLSSERSSRDRFILETNSTDLTTLRIAYIPDPSLAPIFDSFATSIVLGGDVSVAYSMEEPPKSATIKFNFKVVDGYGQPLETDKVMMYALPHHIDSLDSASVVATQPVPLRTSRGKLTGVVGSSWTLVEPLTTLGWTAPRPFDARKLSPLKSALQKEAANLVSANNDTYSTGKYVSALARLVLIADEVNDTRSRDIALTKLNKLMTRWMNRVTYRDTFLYDLTWGGVISANGWADKNQDYGNIIYNDHHYHNGYYIYAGAVLLKYVPTWPYREHLIDLVRDIANPSSADPYFPVTRHKDWYLGHSWAQGIDPTHDGKNQESTSEAVNAYYAVYLLGLALGNKEMRDFGRLLLATELRSTHRYWQISDNEIYPPEFAKNAVVGILWSSKADYSTFFGRNVEFIHCIQMMPFTPVTELLLPEPWMKVDWPVLSTALDPDRFPRLEETWRALVLMAQAILDRDTAYSRSLFLSDDAFQQGNSKTNLIYWMWTRPANSSTSAKRSV